MDNQRGAPKGGRVHWLLWHLPGKFKQAYILYYNYAKHNYLFERREGRRLLDVFIVKQTSRHYWRVMYANAKTQEYECFGYKNTRLLAEYMFELFEKSNNQE